jgi:D-erythro-7,8-dihydroneopterin triphosphate epimerase
MDNIHIQDLALHCIIGVRPEERLHKQEVVINIGLDCDLSVAGKSDRLDDTVNFRRLEDRIVALVEGSSFQLIERLAQSIADVCLEDRKVLGVQVVVDKPRALRFADSAAVEIYRTRADAKRTKRARGKE